MLKALQYFNLAANAPEETPMAPAADLFEQLVSAMSLANIPYKDLNNMVLYDGNPNSPVMVIGEAPGEDEVLQKKPFVGRSGQLLQKMLDAAGLVRDALYVTNVVVWRPPNNRTPLPEEIDIMRPYVLQHIALRKPKVLLLVGGIATKCVSGASIAISRIRGSWMNYPACEHTMSIFHPSYLLRAQVHKQETWIDIMNIRQKIIDLGYANILSKQTWLR